MKLVTQILILALTPLAIVLGHNFYQSFYLKRTLESHLSNTLSQGAQVSLEYLSRQRTLARQVGHVLATSPRAIEALQVRDSVALHELGAQIVSAGLIDSVVFIDANGYVAARSNEMYHFNDSIQSHPLWSYAAKNKGFEGVIELDSKPQMGVFLPVIRFQTNLIGYVLVTHYLDDAFMDTLHRGDLKALLNTDSQWRPSVYTHYCPIDPALPTLDDKKYTLHVWQNSQTQLSFIERFYWNQNLAIGIMMGLFLGLIIWIAKGITKPLRELGLNLDAFAKGDLTLHGLSHALSPKRKGKNEVAVLIEGVLATLRTLALAHQSFELSKEQASQSEAKAKALVEDTLNQLRVPLLSLELHHDVDNRSPQTTEALRVMHAIVDNMQIKLSSNNSVDSKACIIELLEEEITKSAKMHGVDLHVRGIDKLPEILHIDQMRWIEFFDVTWGFLSGFLAQKPQVRIEWKYHNQTLCLDINSPTHIKALHLMAGSSWGENANIDAIVRLHVGMFVYLGAKFETTDTGIQIIFPSVKTATIKASPRQSPL